MPSGSESGEETPFTESLVEHAQRERPGVDNDWRVETPRAVDPRLPVAYFLYFDALEELVFAADYRDEPCVALLDGELGVDETGTFVELTGFSDLQYTGDLRGIHLPLRNALAARLDGEARDEDDPFAVAGFYVGAAGSDGELLDAVARVHLSLFNIPYQVALVADPEAERVGLYARDDDGRFVNDAFRVVYDGD